MKKWSLLILVVFPSLAQARVPDWWRRVGWVEADEQRTDGADMARLATRGPVKLRLGAISADIEVVAGADRQITVKLIEGDGARVTFREEGGDRVELLFNGVPMLRCGRLCVEVPARSAVDLSSDSGDVVVHTVGGDVRARSTAGDVRVESAGSVDVRSVSGDVAVSSASGEVRVDTVSGDISVGTLGSGTRLQANTTSGDVHWTGSCGSGCRLEARTLSGDVGLSMGEKSSFALRFVSHGGEVSDELNLNYAGTRPPHESNLRARYGSGEGLVEAQTFSGDLHLARAR